MITPYLTLAAMLFCIGLYGALTKKNAIIILLSIELMFNAVHLNFVVFANYAVKANIMGQLFSLFSIAISGAEVAIAVAVLIALFRRRANVNASEFNEMRG